MVNRINVRNPRGRPMSTPTPHPQHGTPPSLAALTAQFLDRRSRDPGPDPDWCSTGVEPHEAPSGFRTDARTTWAEALVAVKVGAGVTALPPAPAAWGGLSRQLPTRFAVPLCVGNFPQLLGDVPRLFAENDLSPLTGRADGGEHRTDSTELRPSDRSGKTSPEVAALL